jgi:glycosyltransferase involved in cell wall biosynthesis
MARRSIVMVGPAASAQGGIGRVVAVWHRAGFFDDIDLTHVVSAADGDRGKVGTLLRALAAFIAAVATRPCLVWIHTSSRNSFWRKSLFVLLARAFRRDVVMHVHPSGFLDFLDGLAGARRRYALWVLRRARLLVVLTEEVAARLSAAVPGTPVEVLRNGVLLAEMRDAPGVTRAGHRLLYLGQFLRAKGVYDLVDAVEALRRDGVAVELDLHGTRETEELRAYVEERSSPEVVRVRGWIGDDEKLAALHSATLLVLPSHSEGIPNVILEAMASHTPIVSTRVGGLTEVLRDGENCLVARARDPAHLAERIRRLLDDPALRARLAENAFDEASRKYDARALRGQFTRIVDRLVGPEGGVGRPA